jgi:PAS domain S-box-containing protein
MAGQLRQRDLAWRNTVARLEALLRTAADGILTFNERGIIEDFNQAAEKMFGYSAEEIKGQQVQQLMDVHDFPLKSKPGSEDTPSMMFVSTVVDTPDVIRRGRRRDGSVFWMEAAFSKVPVVTRMLFMAIFRDVTRRVEDQEKIRQITESLEARVRLRTAELEDAKAKLEMALQAAQSANRAKDEFVRTVSHELRTPLSAVKGYTELLLNPRAARLRENPGPTLEKILRASDFLLTLINDLLDVARASAGRPIELTLSQFEVETLLSGLLEMASPLLKKNTNRLTSDLSRPLGTMYADETRVRQILLNLLSNACKFTSKGTIRFQAVRGGRQGDTETRRHGDTEIGRQGDRETGRQGDKETRGHGDTETAEGDWLIFTVADTGCGMTPEQLGNLFQPFYRVDNSTSRASSGTGLGLSITKILCERMGGTIEVASEPGAGTTFVVRLPAVVSSQ